jgi:pectate lyase
MRHFEAACAAGASVLALVVASPAAAAAMCQQISAEAQTFATGPTTFAGTVTGTLGGDPFSSSVITTVTSAPQPAGASGVLFATTSHTIALPTGTVTTSDSARLIPTGQPGLYRIVSKVTVVGGGSGQMVFNGTVDLVGGSTQFQVHGAVCSG